MKSIITYLEGFDILLPLPSKLPHEQTRERIEDEKLNQMTSKERIDYLSKKEKKEKRRELIAAGIIGGGLVGVGGLSYYLSKNRPESDFEKEYREQGQKIKDAEKRIKDQQEINNKKYGINL